MGDSLFFCSVRLVIEDKIIKMYVNLAIFLPLNINIFLYPLERHLGFSVLRIMESVVTCVSLILDNSTMCIVCDLRTFRICKVRNLNLKQSFPTSQTEMKPFR